MKKILVTGENSYIGNLFIKFIEEYQYLDYQVDKISLKNNMWRTRTFNEYDVVIHLAGIVHLPSAPSFLYYKINRDLTLDFAKKVKNDGVPHFIFFSSLSVYGLDSGLINKETKTKPKNDYGKSKLEAEYELSKLEDCNFTLSIVRPPIVYGPRCPGNFSKLIKLFGKLPIFFNLKNERSMIFIDNLFHYLLILIKNKIPGIIVPQNSKYIATVSIYKEFKQQNKEKFVLVPIYFPKKVLNKIPVVKKVFGDLKVDKSLSVLPIKFEETPFEKSISLSIEEKRAKVKKNTNL
ncbi:NAD-dependent epimerase/dehydratase family protein [Exiguobacterium sp. s50]|uniref:NAD-dependent epimerase/dehydratase family protein n=1 Tax=Exiguobacterium sp. s50 TaxID=2751234 RepID=UPI001BEC38EE